MLRWFCLFACLYMFFGAVAFADPVTLRARVEATGPAVTMGDVFVGAPANVAGRAIAPAPPPGQLVNISMAVISAAASAAGLEFTPPAGVTHVQVIRPGGMRATLPPPGGQAVGEAVIRRGETVTLTYAAPGIALTLRARALEDGAVGESIRFLNPASNRQIDAVVTAAGQATASP
ncbi:MAG: flagella basal body P-ring formation protein FlgA [Hyphomonadaceae bacterium]|nr:flagella basal body P-ring formation protein FlgA [Hyphomonadaceae bacterium]